MAKTKTAFWQSLHKTPKYQITFAKALTSNYETKNNRSRPQNARGKFYLCQISECNHLLPGNV